MLAVKAGLCPLVLIVGCLAFAQQSVPKPHTSKGPLKKATLKEPIVAPLPPGPYSAKYSASGCDIYPRIDATGHENGLVVVITKIENGDAYSERIVTSEGKNPVVKYLKNHIPFESDRDFFPEECKKALLLVPPEKKKLFFGYPFAP